MLQCLFCLTIFDDEGTLLWHFFHIHGMKNFQVVESPCHQISSAATKSNCSTQGCCFSNDDLRRHPPANCPLNFPSTESKASQTTAVEAILLRDEVCCLRDDKYLKKFPTNCPFNPPLLSDISTQTSPPGSPIYQQHHQNPIVVSMESSPSSFDVPPPPPASSSSSSKRRSTRGGSDSKKKTTFTCTICEKLFKQKIHLKKHMAMSHSFAKPFPCSYCTYAAVDSGHLKEHIRRHTGEKPFLCEHCSQAFKQRSALSYHIRTHHK